MTTPAQRSEQTGNPMLDRIQATLRESLAFAKQLLARVLGLETAHGTGTLATIEINDADYTMTPAQFASGYWLFTGKLTANRRVIVPRCASGAAWSRWVYNFTSGGFTVRIVNDVGSLSVPNATGAHCITTHDAGPESWL